MRRMYTPLTSPRQVLSFVPLVERATHELLRKVSASTDGSTVPEHLQWCATALVFEPSSSTNAELMRFTGSIILKIVFGYTIEEKDDPFVRDADRAMKHFSASTSPGWLVDVIPFRASSCLTSFVTHPSDVSSTPAAMDAWFSVSPASRTVEERGGHHV